jgi:hypothetical protein
MTLSYYSWSHRKRYLFRVALRIGLFSPNIRIFAFIKKCVIIDSFLPHRLLILIVITSKSYFWSVNILSFSVRGIFIFYIVNFLIAYFVNFERAIYYFLRLLWFELIIKYKLIKMHLSWIFKSNCFQLNWLNSRYCNLFNKRNPYFQFYQ